MLFCLFCFFACVFCGPLNVYLQHTRDVIPWQKGREKQERAISGQSTGLIPNWGVILQACVYVQSSADKDTSGRTPAPPASLFSWVQQHLAEKQCSPKEHLHDREQPSLQTFLMKVVTVPNERAAMLMQHCLKHIKYWHCFLSGLLGNIFTALKYAYMFHSWPNTMWRNIPWHTVMLHRAVALNRQ